MSISAESSLTTKAPCTVTAPENSAVEPLIAALVVSTPPTDAVPEISTLALTSTRVAFMFV